MVDYVDEFAKKDNPQQNQQQNQQQTNPQSTQQSNNQQTNAPANISANPLPTERVEKIIADSIKKEEQKTGQIRIKSGIPGLDEIVGGGLDKGSIVLIRGGTGTGKTLLCSQYLYNGAKLLNEPAMFLSFTESKDSIYKHGLSFGWDFKELEKKDLFTFIRYSPHEVVKIIEEGGGSIHDAIEGTGIKRLVIDSLTAYALLFESEYRADQSVLNLTEMLHNLNCTTLVTSEKSVDPFTSDHERLGFLTDGIVNLYYMRKGYGRIRALEIIKMRDTYHSDRTHIFKIGNNGIAIQLKASSEVK